MSIATKCFRVAPIPCRSQSCLYRYCHRHISSHHPTERQMMEAIKQETKLSRDHMTPEIALHLITEDCAIWGARVDDGKTPFPDPFWGFYWPGGQVMSRFILDNPGVVEGQTVLDVGSGCGATAIAAAMAGARTVIANDIDPYSTCAIKLNARENDIHVDVDLRNLIGQQSSEWSTILLGDMFYDSSVRDELVQWLIQHCRTFNSNVFIGDPGRLPLMESSITNTLVKMAEYELSEAVRKDNYGLTQGYVWKLAKC